MAYIGTALPVGNDTSHGPIRRLSDPSMYCPSWAIKETGELVRGNVTIDDIREDIRLYRGSSTPKFSDPLLDDVIRDCFFRFQVSTKVRPIHLNDIPKYPLDNWNSSPGLPWKDYGFETKREVASDHNSFKSIRRLWHLVKEGEDISLPDCVVYGCVSEGEKNVRAVWDYPATVSFMEACFALPLINTYKEAGPIAFGYETAHGGCRHIFHRMANYKNFMSPVYFQFDKTVPTWLIRDAFDILLSNMDLTRYHEEGIPDTAKLYIVWKKIVAYFINTNIRMCNGERYCKGRGIASGSYFTQLIDSIVNWIVTQYAVRKQGLRIYDHLVLGDNSLVATDSRVCANSFAKYAAKFGMKINTSETQIVDKIQEVKFLGYFINMMI